MDEHEAAVEGSPHSNATRMLGILNSANQAFVGMDAAGRITDWNRQAEMTFGWPSEEAIGRFLAETILVAEFRAGLTWFLPGGKDGMLNRRFESRAVDRNGREFPVELALWEVNGGGGRASFHALIHDISERRRLSDAPALRQSPTLRAPGDRSESRTVVAAVHLDPVPGDIAGLFRAQIDDERGDLVRAAHPGRWDVCVLTNPRPPLVLAGQSQIRLEIVVSVLGGDPARRHGVDGDAVLGVLVRHSLEQTDGGRAGRVGDGMVDRAFRLLRRR